MDVSTTAAKRMLVVSMVLYLTLPPVVLFQADEVLQ
jgi:hypothetical protein